MLEWFIDNGISIIALVISIYSVVLNKRETRKTKEAEYESLKKTIKHYGSKLSKGDLAHFECRFLQLHKELGKTWSGRK